ncbi:MAG: hypothetical protein GY949_18515, partial [Gammaproteobacteria bacterium]|nr:hypothetical protein [Gammaproteobacteria bacterium]
ALVGGAHTISLLSALPDITETVIIDGTQDSDFAGTPIIVLDGSSAGGGVDGLRLAAGSDGSTIQGLVINQFTGAGIEIYNSDNNLIVGNYLGTDAAGTAALGNSGNNINIYSGASNNVIGGSAAGAGNVIADAGNDGISIWHGTTTGNTVQGNYIGTDISGTIDLGNSAVGVVVSGGSNNNLIGGTDAGEGNVIAFNNDSGVEVRNDVGTLDNTVLGNSIYSNVQLGIDLGGTGVSSNDANDVDTGANNFQNFPVITAAATAGSQIEISGTLDTDGLNQDYRIEFFATGTPDGTGYGEAERYLGFATITTDGSGGASFTATIEVLVYAGEAITATATVDNGGGSYGDTSEFALNFTATTATNEAPTFMPVLADGIFTTPIGLVNDLGRGVTVQSDGKILVAGYSDNGGFYD